VTSRTGALLCLLLSACDDSGGSSTDAGSMPLDGSGGGSSDARLVDAPGGSSLASTLTASCATLQGRAIVNENGNLGIAFTEDDSPYTFLGSVQFELPSGYTGAVPDPENWDGSSPRRVIAASSPSYETFGNHCWTSGQPTGGSIDILDYRPAQGIVKAVFSGYQLRSCTGSSVCTISGMVETTGEGVFD